MALAALLFSWRYGEAEVRRGAEALIAKLETRFDRPRIEDWSSVSGLVVLGGQPTKLRLKETFRLAETYPHLRIVVSGPNDEEKGIIANVRPELRNRIVLELKSLKVHEDTYGNAVFSTELIHPAHGERWLLVTSATHMPRAIGTFHKAGFPIEPWPVLDTPGDLEYLLKTARREWLGLIAYRLLGRTGELFPGP
jgi:uncharacterized SAM-binding protein YcdF (DUF218 family)